jgi:hypothetical protein
LFRVTTTCKAHLLILDSNIFNSAHVVPIKLIFIMNDLCDTCFRFICEILPWFSFQSHTLC